jgi:hypothetical protein
MRALAKGQFSWPFMPIEIYRGHVLDPDQLEALRLQLENFATIDEVDPELRGIIERTGPTWQRSCRQKTLERSKQSLREWTGKVAGSRKSCNLRRACCGPFGSPELPS